MSALTVGALTVIGVQPASAVGTTTSFVEAVDTSSTFVSTNGSITIGGDSTHLFLSTGDTSLRLAARSGETLVPGTYENAKMFILSDPLGPDPGILVTDGTLGRYGCGLPAISAPPVAGTGRFVIDEITYSGGGSPVPVSAAVRFEYRCTPYTKIIYGAIAKDAGVTTYPTHILSPASLAFGAVPPGPGSTLPLQITNTGLAPLTVTGVAVGGTNAPDFSVDGSACTSGPVAPSGSCSISVTFAPTGSAGARTAKVFVNDTITPSPGPGRQVFVTGTPVPAAPTLTATAGQESVDLTWTVPTSVGPPINGYKIFRSTSSGTETLLKTVGNVTATTDAALGADGSTYFYTVSATNSVGEGPKSNEASATPTASSFGEFTPLSPTRILDTRFGPGPQGKVGAGLSIVLDITGHSDVPDEVIAVVMNVTATSAVMPHVGYVTVYPDDQLEPPTAANINFAPGETRPNLVTVAVGANGKVRLFNGVGSIHLVADLMGYYADTDGTPGSRFHGITPTRAIDTRFGFGAPRAKVGPSGFVPLEVRHVPGIPSGVTAVVMNVTVTNPTPPAFGWITVYPGDLTEVPTAANLNFVPGQTVPNLVIARVPTIAASPEGIVKIENGPYGSTDIVVDVVGYYDEIRSTQAGRLIPVEPTRVFDTRFDFDPVGPLFPEEGVQFDFGPGVGAIVANTAITAPTAIGWLTVFPGSEFTVPEAANLNFVPGLTVSNLVMAKHAPGGDGTVWINGYYGTVHVIVDLNGIFSDATVDFSGSFAAASLQAQLTAGRSGSPPKVLGHPIRTTRTNPSRR